MISDVTGIVLAGGKSRRMGQDKRFVRVGDATLLGSVLEALTTVFESVCMVIGQDSPEISTQVPVFRDLVSDCGSLGGIYTGLKSCDTPYAFVAACDMPFLSPTVIRFLVGLKEEGDLIIPRTEFGVHPTHALYSRRCLPSIEQMVQTRRLKIQDLLTGSHIRVRVVEVSEIQDADPEGHTFFNVNTPGELEAAKRIASHRREGTS